MTPTQRSAIKLTTDRSTAVNHEFHWIPVTEVTPPRGTKVLLINEARGVGTSGEWVPGSEWTHWQGWPKFKRSHPSIGPNEKLKR